MPYVSQQQRRILADPEAVPQGAGELNYRIAVILRDNAERPWGYRRGLVQQEIDRFLAHGRSYQAFNDVIGVLKCAALELQRRGKKGAPLLIGILHDLYESEVAPYEDEKILENGDVWTP